MRLTTCFLPAVLLLGLFSASCVQEECTTLGEAESTRVLSARSVDNSVPQVQIDAKFIAVNINRFDSLGLDLALTTSILTDDGIPDSAYSEDSRDLAAGSAVLGGEPDTLYMVPGEQPLDGFLGFVNLDFRPAPLTQIFVQLPPVSGCVNFNESDVTVPQDFGGLDDHRNLTPGGQDYGGGLIHYLKPDSAAVASLIETLQGNSVNHIVNIPRIVLHDGQRAICMFNDYQPDLEDIPPDFSAAVSQVTSTPYGIFTGPSLDITPNIKRDGSIDMEVRFGTQALSFYYSTPFRVGAKDADLTVPEVQSGKNRISINLKSGKTVLIGGLTPSGEASMTNGVPGLSDIPLLGSLFEGDNFSAQNHNLIILITPQIVTAGN